MLDVPWLFGAASRVALLVEKARGDDREIMAAKHLGAATAPAAEGRRTPDRRHDRTEDLMAGPGAAILFFSVVYIDRNSAANW